MVTQLVDIPSLLWTLNVIQIPYSVRETCVCLIIELYLTLTMNCSTYDEAAGSIGYLNKGPKRTNKSSLSNTFRCTE
jgi:hypothetical protein